MIELTLEDVKLIINALSEYSKTPGMDSVEHENTMILLYGLKSYLKKKDSKPPETNYVRRGGATSKGGFDGGSMSTL